MPIARNGKVQIDYEVTGSGPPLLLIHGLGYGRWGWCRQIASWSRRFTVVALDNRGVGKSTAVTEPYGVHDMAADAVAVMDAAGIDKASIVATSLGGVVAQIVAAEHPERTDKLVLINTTHSGPDAVPIPPDSVALLTDPAPKLTVEQRVRRNMALGFREGWPDDHSDEYDEIIALRLAFVPPWEAYAAQAAAGAAADTSGLLGRISAPTLLVAGTADRIVPFENSELLAKGIAGARIEYIEDGGHLLMFEEPDEINRLVESFCATD